MIYTLPKLLYPFDALEPSIDAETMKIHYTKHHQTYVDKLNTVVSKYPALSEMSVTTLLEKLSTLQVDEKDRTAIRNAGGGHANHTFFWSILGPKKNPNTTLIKKITETFHSTDEFKKLFSDVALNHFGSGWAWLVENKQKKLTIYSTPNQDSPLSTGDTPLVTLDIWEHAYYLKYQNRRAEYITNWWNVLTLL
jgi:superoxide dismutase, Fe-Mn family